MIGTSADGSVGALSVAISFVDNQVVLGVRGSLNLFRAPDLRAILEAVIDRGHRSVVLDLARTGFIDTTGLQVIIDVAGLLKSSGGELALRSPPAVVRQLLAITILSDQVRLDGGTGGESRGSAQEVSHLTASATNKWAHPAHPAHPAGSSLEMTTDDEVVEGALRLAIALAAATVEGADGVSVSLQRDGRLVTVAASDQAISDVDSEQYANGEGPCVDASLEGRWFHMQSVDEEHRWPAFVPKAREHGINAILASPLIAGGQPVGALNVYSRTAGAFGAEEQKLASLVADEASVILTSAGWGTSTAAVAGRRTAVLRARQVIAQAIGVVMEREGISEEGAFTILRRSSQRSGRPLREHAEGVIASTGAPRLNDPTSSF
jgi:anti-anti-sigma factor